MDWGPLAAGELPLVVFNPEVVLPIMLGICDPMLLASKITEDPQTKQISSKATPPTPTLTQPPLHRLVKAARRCCLMFRVPPQGGTRKGEVPTPISSSITNYRNIPKAASIKPVPPVSRGCVAPLGIPSAGGCSTTSVPPSSVGLGAEGSTDSGATTKTFLQIRRGKSTRKVDTTKKANSTHNQQPISDKEAWKHITSKQHSLRSVAKLPIIDSWLSA